MNKITISQKELKRLIKEEASKIIKEEADKIIDAGDTIDVNMNQMDRVDNSDGSAYTKNSDGQFEKKKANMENSEIPTDVKMNQNDNDQGHDEKIASAVKVDAANSTKKGTSDNPHIEGMKNGNFESKKGNQSTKSSTPYNDREDNVDMNAEDREMDEGAKTYVEAGGDVKGGEKHTTGQKKAVVKEKAPEKEDSYGRIAKGIELPEGFKSKKELIKFINEEAQKASKLLPEGKKNKKNLNEGWFEDYEQQRQQEKKDHPKKVAFANKLKPVILQLLNQVFSQDGVKNINTIREKVEALEHATGFDFQRYIDPIVSNYNTMYKASETLKNAVNNAKPIYIDSTGFWDTKQNKQAPARPPAPNKQAPARPPAPNKQAPARPPAPRA